MISKGILIDRINKDLAELNGRGVPLSIVTTENTKGIVWAVKDITKPRRADGYYWAKHKKTGNWFVVEYSNGCLIDDCEEKEYSEIDENRIERK